MTVDDWKRVIDQLAQMRVPMIQFIGGEPTLHPNFEELVRYALSKRLEVEVFTNLVKLTDDLLWLYGNRHVRLATSYYTIDASEHAEITHGAKAYELTTKHIRQVVRAGIPLRVGIIDVKDGQRYEEAAQLLRAMGVTNIGFDRLREVGRGIRAGEEGVKQLCGNCIRGVIAISPDGMVWPCVFSRFLPIGNVRIKSLAELLGGRKYAQTYVRLKTEFDSREGAIVPHGTGEMPSTEGPVTGRLKGDNSVDSSTSGERCEPWCAPHCFSREPFSPTGCAPDSLPPACPPMGSPTPCPPACAPPDDTVKRTIGGSSGLRKPQLAIANWTSLLPPEAIANNGPSISFKLRLSNPLGLDTQPPPPPPEPCPPCPPNGPACPPDYDEAHVLKVRYLTLVR
jgi:hypothetical protein